MDPGTTTAMLTRAQIDRFAADGFLVVPDAVPANACLEARARAEALAAELAPAHAASTFSAHDHPQDDDEAFLASASGIRCFWEPEAATAPADAPPIDRLNKIGHALHDLDTVFAGFSRQPVLEEVVRDLGVVEPLLLQSMYMVKAPRVGGEVTWHDDHTYLWSDPPSALGLWIAIDDATEENGCLWAIPGDHRGAPRRRYRRRAGGLVTETLDDRPYPVERAVPLPAARGTLVVLHGLCPHASPPNRSAAPRHAYTVHVVDARADYPADNWLQRDGALPLRGFAATGTLPARPSPGGP